MLKVLLVASVALLASACQAAPSPQPTPIMVVARIVVDSSYPNELIFDFADRSYTVTAAVSGGVAIRYISVQDPAPRGRVTTLDCTVLNEFPVVAGAYHLIRVSGTGTVTVERLNVPDIEAGPGLVERDQPCP